MKIDIDKNYRTRDGKAVRLLAVDRDHDSYPVIALVQIGVNESLNIYTKEGHFSRGASEPNALDLVEVGTYENFQIDDKVIVWNNDDDLRTRGHFAGIEDDQPTAWKDGATYWSSKGCVRWDCCIKAG